LASEGPLFFTAMLIAYRSSLITLTYGETRFSAFCACS
jgi:hypothetical protein